MGTRTGQARTAATSTATARGRAWGTASSLSRRHGIVAHMAAIRPYLALLGALILGVMTHTRARPVLAFVTVSQPATAKVTGVHGCKERPPPDGSRSNFDGFAE